VGGGGVVIDVFHVYRSILEVVTYVDTPAKQLVRGHPGFDFCKTKSAIVLK
jgi:hypothetical protein